MLIPTAAPISKNNNKENPTWRREIKPPISTLNDPHAMNTNPKTAPTMVVLAIMQPMTVMMVKAKNRVPDLTRFPRTRLSRAS